MDNIQHNLVTGHPRECMLSCFHHVHLFATPWTVAHKAPLFLGFSRQEYWSGLPRPPPGDLPDPGVELTSLYVSCIGRRHKVPNTCGWEMTTSQHDTSVHVGENQGKHWGCEQPGGGEPGRTNRGSWGAHGQPGQLTAEMRGLGGPQWGLKGGAAQPLWIFNTGSQAGSHIKEKPLKVESNLSRRGKGDKREGLDKSGRGNRTTPIS